ncbi:MAG: hypothetical protein LBH21_07565, partial [Gracilibacteraceae bacterium]|nr:hypothetical protein [Gracilibacteraceae bacterium]
FAGTEPEGSSAGAQARGGINPAEAESGPAGVSVRPEAAGGRLPAEYVDPAGGLCLLPHSGPDSLLTARAVAAAPGCVNPEQTREYFYGILSQGGAEPAETAAAYLGLSALGAPVLTDIHALLPNRGAEFSLRDCLRLAAGLALLGDGAGAAAWYEEFIAPLAVAADETLFIDAGAGDAEDIYALTAEAAMLASLTGHSQAAPLLVYVLEREGAYSPLFELMTVLRLTPAPAGGGAVLRYKTASGEVSVDLGAEAVHRLSLSQKQLTAAGFRAEGDVRAAALHPAAAGLSPDSSGKITITKTYVPRGGLIQVTIDVHLQNNAPLPLYTLADTLPAGLRFAGVEAGGQGDWYLSGENGGRVDFVLNRVRENEGAQIEILADFQVTYLARAVLPGEFLADSAEARHADSGLRGATVPVLQTFQLAR